MSIMANVPIEEKLIKVNTKCRPGIVRQKKWVVVHETGNSSKGAGADNHASYLSNLAKQNAVYLSWHYTVDDKKIIRHVPDNEVTWNAGDGTTEGGGNYAGISIEICVNPDSNFNKAMDNTASLIADLLVNHNLPLSAVKQHHDFATNGKNCPETMRNNGLWDDFVQKVANYLNKSKSPQNATQSEYKHKVGDHVAISSGYKSSTDNIDKAIIYGAKMKTGFITRIVKGRNPYLVTVENNPNSTPICWVNDGDIRICNGVSMDMQNKKSIDEIAREVINGKWGNGDERKKRLTDAGYDYKAVQKRVNQLV